MRLFAATIVIFSHSFLLAQGNQNGEPLLALTGQAVLGVVGVFIFFIISGYLVTQSFERSGSAPRFLAKRALRIFPGLWICLLICTLVIGGVLTSLPLGVYLGDPGTWRFLWHNALLEVSVNTLPGVKFTDFPDGWNVNGPLWSLPFEAMMYLMVALIGVMGMLRLGMLIGLFLIGVGCAWIDTRPLGNLVHGFLWLLSFFTAGMIATKLPERWLHDRRVAALAIAGLIVSAWGGQLNTLFGLFGGYLVLHLATDPRLPALRTARFGDLSYGLYIYGWPVEQVIAHAGQGRFAWWQVFGLAWPVTALLALVSWHLIEHPALRLKPLPARRANQKLKRHDG